ncbi:MAG: 2Fe-2S iron-sulfur cluster-binding protein, partial [Planctomycetota bacterium]
MSETFAITINEKEYQVCAGQSILEVALANGIEIPNLCHDPRLVPTGSCRLCVVEVEGQRVPVPACTFAVGEGMVVKTDTEELFRLRKTVLELLFYEHRGVCTTCDENGECRLQRYGYEYQLSDSVFQAPEKGVEEPNYTTGNEGIHYRTDKCIRCGRCIRI